MKEGNNVSRLASLFLFSLSALTALNSIQERMMTSPLIGEGGGRAYPGCDESRISRVSINSTSGRVVVSEVCG